MMMSGRKSVDQLHLAGGLPAGDGHHGAAQVFGAVMDAEAAGEQAVAMGDVEDVAGRPPAARIERATTSAQVLRSARV